MKQHIRDHFKKNDPKLYEWIEKISWYEWEKPKNLFIRLCDEIISQQLSGKASATIFNRFQKLFPDENITPEYLLQLKDEEIRKAGTSWNKIKSLKDLATKVVSRELDLEKLIELPDEKVTEQLVKVRGIGPWTAEMFLIFSLGREDIFSFGDLGLKRGIQKIYELKTEPTKKQIEKIVEKWKPYRSYASRILWLSLEVK